MYYFSRVCQKVVNIQIPLNNQRSEHKKKEYISGRFIYSFHFTRFSFFALPYTLSCLLLPLVACWCCAWLSGNTKIHKSHTKYIFKCHLNYIVLAESCTWVLSCDLIAVADRFTSSRVQICWERTTTIN